MRIRRFITAGAATAALVVAGLGTGAAGFAQADTTPTVGVGTSLYDLNPQAPFATYFGVTHAVKGDPEVPADIAAKDDWSYPPINGGIAPGDSLTELMNVNNAGTATEAITITGTPANAIEMSSLSGGLVNYIPQAPLADGSTLDYIGYTMGGPSNSLFGVNALPASWITAPANQVLTPGQTVQLPVTITVPADAQPGTYYGAVEGTACGQSASGSGGSGVGVGIQNCAASGVRAYITVK